ncbi:MAG: hypothetical protein RBR43_07825 [Desulfuromonadaceae bacterium]|jgi:hypothetical protein|nr:hypothetical protein [Desulfuromonadaceae bacterium]
MATVTVEVYKILAKKLGEAEATEIVKAIDSAASDIAIQKKLEVRDELVKELASKADLLAVKAELREEIGKLDGKMKLYFVITIAVILLSNSKAMDIIGNLLGLIR